MGAHTPGPWEVIDGAFPAIKEVAGPSFMVSAVMWAADLTEDDFRKRTADMRLIAAAPELLKELQHLVRLLEPAEKDGAIDVPGLATLNAARATIRKATGG